MALGVVTAGCESFVPDLKTGTALVVGEYVLSPSDGGRRTIDGDRLCLCPDMTYVHLEVGQHGVVRRERSKWELDISKRGRAQVFLFDFNVFTPGLVLVMNPTVAFVDGETPVTELMFHPDLNHLFVRVSEPEAVNMVPECSKP